MRVNIPSPQSPVLRGREWVFETTWFRYFAALQQVSPVAAVVVAPSPATYEAGEGGTLVVTGGTVSLITITRGLDVINMGVTSGPVPMAKGDVATITYTVLPTVTFLGG